MSEARPEPEASYFHPDSFIALSGSDDDPLGAVTDPDAALPPTIPGFHTGRLLGRGGSASVWLVTDAAGHRFALKVAHVRSRTPQSDFPGPSEVPGPSVPPMPGRRARRALPPPGDRPGMSASTSGGELPSGSAVDDLLGSDRSAGPRDAISRGGATGDDLLRELRLQQHIDHEHLVRVHRIIDTDQGPALLMNLAAGGSLLELVRSRGPCPKPRW